MTVTLPLPDGGTVVFTPTVAFVAALENAHGSIFKTADRLVAQDLPLTDIIRILSHCYVAAGYADDPARLDMFLLRAAPAAPAALLADILVHILNPLHAMGAVKTT